MCDVKKDRLQVFSLTGEHRRSITRTACVPLLRGWRISLFAEVHERLPRPADFRPVLAGPATCCRSTRILSRGRASANRSAISTVSCLRV